MFIVSNCGFLTFYINYIFLWIENKFVWLFKTMYNNYLDNIQI